jgi:hypothetical protein
MTAMMINDAKIRYQSIDRVCEYHLLRVHLTTGLKSDHLTFELPLALDELNDSKTWNSKTLYSHLMLIYFHQLFDIDNVLITNNK